MLSILDYLMDTFEFYINEPFAKPVVRTRDEPKQYMILKLR